MTARPLELTDLLGVDDGSTQVEEIVERPKAGGQHRAARLARRLPAVDGTFDQPALSALLLRVHCELQRLGEELQLPRRVASVLVPWVHDLQRRRPGAPVRIVDVGCGLGYVVRWLSAHRVSDETVELIGVDFNTLLVRQAVALARTERLACRFVAGDALQPGTAVGEGRDTILVVRSPGRGRWSACSAASRRCERWRTRLFARLRSLLLSQCWPSSHWLTAGGMPTCDPRRPWRIEREEFPTGRWISSASVARPC